MSNTVREYKIGLTRNRLFEFSNTVIFVGEYCEKLDETRVQKAIKALCIKEPILKSRVELRGEDAFLVLDESIELFEKTDLTAAELKSSFSENGLNFWESLFKIFLTGDNRIFIASHTSVSDCKSLLNLANDFVSIYRDKEVLFNESKIFTFPKTSDLPADVVSPLTDKLSAELEALWQKHKKVYTVEDYKRARIEFLKLKDSMSEIIATLPCEVINKLKDFCAEEKVDVLSAVAFCFFEELKKVAGGSKKTDKIVIDADRRFFFNEPYKYRVGAFNGSVEASLSSKKQKTHKKERLKAFHLNCYKGLTSSFRSFYDDVFFSKLSPSFCDSSYMYLAGFEKNKASKKLCNNYGCGSEKLCEYNFYNLDQAYYEKLKSFDKIEIEEPFKNKFTFSVNFILFKGQGFVTLKVNKNKCKFDKAEKGFEDALLKLKNL